eukprot:m.945886 g.945886  ORF g.945886 m.945886 type:complete len:54 (+) comp290360_c0_seq1:42-203(+)
MSVCGLLVLILSYFCSIRRFLTWYESVKRSFFRIPFFGMLSLSLTSLRVLACV